VCQSDKVKLFKPSNFPIPIHFTLYTTLLHSPYSLLFTFKSSLPSVPFSLAMGRAPCCDKANVKRGPWSPEEDETLKNYLKKHGTGGNWITLPQKAGFFFFVFLPLVSIGCSTFVLSSFIIFVCVFFNFRP